MITELESELVLRFLLGLLPVCLFLFSLVYLDSYKLVGFRSILLLIVAGSAAAVASFFLNRVALQSTVFDHRLITRFGAPLIEEVLKGLPVFLLIRTRRIGFLVDAAISGFAIGTGFALIENIYYLRALPDASLGLWVVRGFGTAVMHGGATAILAIVTRAFTGRKESDAPWLALPGLLVAVVIHATFNQFVISPMLTTILVMIALPPLLMAVFHQSDRYLQSWLGKGFDLDTELLKAISSGDFAQSKAGRYLQALRQHFSGEVVADMLCYLRLQTELSLRAKGILMMRESGFSVKKDADTKAKLDELRYLRRSIGKTGQLALRPILHLSSHDLWQLQILERGE